VGEEKILGPEGGGGGGTLRGKSRPCLCRFCCTTEIPLSGLRRVVFCLRHCVRGDGLSGRSIFLDSLGLWS
jgi:hypothetical protein